jgi:hypothetical protein
VNQTKSNQKNLRPLSGHLKMSPNQVWNWKRSSIFLFFIFNFGVGCHPLKILPGSIAALTSYWQLVIRMTPISQSCFACKGRWLDETISLASAAGMIMAML